MTDKVVLLQTTDPTTYFKLWSVTSRTATEYCARHHLLYEAYIGIKRGSQAAHAAFNRIYMFAELISRGHRSWAIYLDADAYIADLSVDLAAYLRDKAGYAAILAPSGATEHFWDVNNGVMLLQLGHPLARQIVERWFAALAAITDAELAAEDALPPADWQQVLLHQVLRADPQFEPAIFRETPLLINGRNARFIRQRLRAHHPDFASRLAAVAAEVDRVLASPASAASAPAPPAGAAEEPAEAQPAAAPPGYRQRFGAPLSVANWYAPECLPDGTTYRWLGPEPSSTFDIHVSRRVPLEVSLTVIRAVTDDMLAGVRLLADGRPLTVRIGTGADGHHRLRAALAAQPDSDRLRLTVAMDRCIAPCDIDPASDDRRPLGIAVSELEILPSLAFLLPQKPVANPASSPAPAPVRSEPGLAPSVELPRPPTTMLGTAAAGNPAAGDTTSDTTVPFARLLAASGWYDAERAPDGSTFRWLGPESTCTIAIGVARNLWLEVGVTMPFALTTELRDSVELLVDGEPVPITRSVLANERHRLTTVIPPAPGPEPAPRLSLTIRTGPCRTPRDVTPPSEDERLLSVAVSEITVAAVAPPAPAERVAQRSDNTPPPV